jgi:predicted CXXCH cytochrome family protein
MRKIQRWLPLLLVGLPLLGAAAFGGGIVVTDHLEEDNTFCTACHLHEKKFTEFHPVEGKRVTLAAAHNIAGDKNVKCIDCHIGATVKDKMIIKFLAARDTVAYFVGAFQEPTHLRYALGTRTCLKCHPTGGTNPEQENAFHNASHHTKMPLLCYECHTVHPTASVETRFLREQTVKPLCDSCHKDMEQ